MPTRYLDISDVIEYFGFQTAASGIQRVQLEFIRYFVAVKDGRYRFVIDAPEAGGFSVVDPALLLRLVDGIDAGSLTREELTALLGQIVASRTPTAPAAGDVFFVSGAFWAPATIVKSMLSAKEQGARVGFLCYDLIALRHPEYCDAGLAAVFKGSLETICHVTDFIFTISEFVKRDVDAYLAELGIELPVIALPLAHELAPAKGSGSVGAAVTEVMKKPYVLFVSTIEARKNHIYTYLLWQKLIEARVPGVPDLVWVGRPGWLVKDMMARLARTGNLGGKIRILSGLTDAELKALYANCQFTIYPSLSEGWGLPVAESLMMGKPAVVSSSSSLPEVGGDFVWYIDPENVSDGFRVVSRLLANPGELAAAQTRIRSSFKPRRWTDVCRDLDAGLTKVTASANRSHAMTAIRYRPGVLYYAGADGRVEGDTVTPAERATLEAAFDNNWFSPDQWGRWMRGLGGGIRFAVPHAGEYVVFVRLHAFGQWQGQRAALHCIETGEEAIFQVAPSSYIEAFVRIKLPEGRVKVILRADRSDVGPGADRRQLSIGLEAFGFAASSDADGLAKLESRKAAPQAVRVAAAATGAATGLLPLDVAPPRVDWRLALMQRTVREGPRVLLVRVLRRVSAALAGGRI